MIFGHLPYGVHKVFIHKKDRHRTIWTKSQLMNMNSTQNILWINKLNYTYATVVRHPLSRVKSHFHFHRVTRVDPNHRWTKGKDLKDWVGFMEDSKDCTVVHIAGVHSKAYWNYNDDNIGRLLPGRSEKQSPRKDWIVTYEHYKIARWNLMNMGWVGIFDKLQRSVDQLKYFWGLPATKISVKNRNIKNPNAGLSEEERQKILEFNPGDTWLYELAVVLNEQQELVLRCLGYSI